MRKKVLSILLVLTMVLTLTPTVAFAATYGDTNGHWAESSIDRWSNAGVVHGTGAGEFNPNGDMSRAEAAQIFANLLRLKETTSISGYSDVDASAWYVDAVSKCVAAGILNGTGGNTMSPGMTVTREQTFVMIARALGVEDQPSSSKTFADAGSVSSWAVGSVNALVNLGVIQGIDASNIGPKVDINRASVMTVMDRLIGTYANTDGEWPIASKGITLVVAEDVSLTGTATDLPIVLAGDTAKVDMSNVTGAAKVVVQADTVDITGAPKDTQFDLSGAGENVTINGEKVESGGNYVEPDGENKPDDDKSSNQGSTSRPGFGPSQNPGDEQQSPDLKQAIDDLIKEGIAAVNKKMDYAQLGNLESTDEGGSIVVNINNGEISISKVKENIINVLIEKLAVGRNSVSAVKAKTAITGAEVPVTGKETLDLTKGSPDDSQIVTFVKQLVPTFDGGMNIGSLYGKSFVVTVVDKNGKGYDYKVSFISADLGAYIESKVDEVNKKIETYAEIKYARKPNDTKDLTGRLTVTVKNANTEVGTVYGGIGDIMLESLNAYRGEIATVQGIGKNGGIVSLAQVGSEYTSTTLIDFVQNLKFSKSTGESIDVTGSSIIGSLNGTTTRFVVIYTDKTDNGTPIMETYEIAFVPGTCDDEITSSELKLNEKLTGIASVAYNEETKTLTVTIENEKETVNTVYGKIGLYLKNAAEAHISQIQTVNGYSIDSIIAEEKESTWIKSFVKSLKFRRHFTIEKNNKLSLGGTNESKKLSFVGIKGSDQLSTIVDYYVNIDVTLKGDDNNNKQELYTINFVKKQKQ